MIINWTKEIPTKIGKYLIVECGRIDSINLDQTDLDIQVYDTEHLGNITYWSSELIKEIFE